MPDSAEAPREAWERVELLRRLYRIIDQDSVMGVARTIDIAKATLYRCMWAERRPSYEFLTKLYRAYPETFPELAILVEDSQ